MKLIGYIIFRGELIMNRTIMKISLFLIIVGALNWGLVGLFNLDLVRSIFSDSIFANIIYIIIGISGIISLSILFSEDW